MFMIMSANEPILLALLCGSMAACSAVQPGGGINPDTWDNIDLYTTDIDAARLMAPQGSQFSQSLRAGYFGLAASQKAQTDLADEAHFTRKAVASAKGLNVQPDMVALRTLPTNRVPEFEAARARLLSALDRGGRLKAADPAARAQVSYDCWLEETASGNTQAAADCQKGFEDAMREVESALATGVGNEYVVFFAWDQADVTPVTRQVLEQVAADYKKGRISRVAIAGHADRSGSPDYNLRLSERRARLAAAELVALSVPQDIMKIEWFGETRPRVPTADGVREAQNRRVEVTFE
jgi:OmpA-OmpF porin, OOP family